MAYSTGLFDRSQVYKRKRFEITLVAEQTHTIFVNVHVDLLVFSLIPKARDPVVEKLYQSTEEGQKVTRNKGVKLVAVFRRIQDPYVT